MLLNNNMYKGTDLTSNRREALKNFFNPYGYNIDSNLKNKNLNNDNNIKTESHSDRSNNKVEEK